MQFKTKHGSLAQHRNQSCSGWSKPYHISIRTCFLSIPVAWVMSEMCWGECCVHDHKTRLSVYRSQEELVGSSILLPLGVCEWKVFLGSRSLAGMVNLSSWKGRMLWRARAVDGGSRRESLGSWGWWSCPQLFWTAVKFRSFPNLSYTGSETVVWKLPVRALERVWTHSRGCDGTAWGTECAVCAGHTCCGSMLGIRAKVCPRAVLCLVRGDGSSSEVWCTQTPTAGSGPSPDGWSLSGSW